MMDNKLSINRSTSDIVEAQEIMSGLALLKLEYTMSLEKSYGTDLWWYKFAIKKEQ